MSNSSKVIGLTILLLIINLSLIIFNYKCDIETGLTSSGDSCETGGVLGIIRDIYNLDGAGTGLNYFVGILGIAATVGAVVGSIWTKDLWPIWAEISAALLITYSSILVNIWQFVYGLPYWGGNTSLALTLSFLFVGPMLLYCIYTLLDWVRSS